MATISITTDYKFTKKSAQKLIDAMEINENNSNVNKTNIKATKNKINLWDWKSIEGLSK